MPSLLLPFHSYSTVDSASSSRLVNCFGELAPQGAKGPIILRRAPGVLTQATPASGIGRGLHNMKGVLYAISGNSLHRVNSAGGLQLLGTVPGTSRTYRVDNGAQLLIIANGAGRMFTLATGVLSDVTDADFTSRTAGPAAFIDNYAAIVDEGTGQWFTTDLADFDSVGGLNFATAEGAPDNLLTLAVDHRQVVLVGTSSTELWDNTGIAGFPFERSPNGLIELGGAAKRGIIKQDQSVCILASDLTFRRLEGNTWVRISQHGVERALRQYSRVDDCEASAYTLDGHLCTAWNFPAAKATWIYDHTSQEWHERESYHRQMWDVSDICECYGKVFVQRASTGEIGVLDRTCYEEWGQRLRAEWTFQSIYGQSKRVTLDRLELGIETGVGIASGQGSAPMISCEISRDGGKTFEPMPDRAIGAQGRYRERVNWDRFGDGYDLVVRQSLSDPVPLTIWDAQASTR